MTSGRLEAGDLVALRLLVDAVEHGSVSAAARAAGLSQPSASDAVRRLERRWGVTLLVRSPQGSRPTAAGQHLAGLARAALVSLDAIAGEAAALHAAERNEVRVAASYTIAEYVLPARLPAGQMAIALAVVNSDEVIARVRAHEADVGFIEGPVDTAGLRVRRIARDELIVVVAPRHHWATRDVVLDAAELAVTPLLLREAESGTRRTYEAALADLGLLAAAPLGVITSTEALKAAVRAGVGASVLSRLAVATELRNGRLVEVPVRGLDLRRELRAVWSPRAAGPLGAAFVRAISALRAPE